MLVRIFSGYDCHWQTKRELLQWMMYCSLVTGLFRILGHPVLRTYAVKTSFGRRPKRCCTNFRISVSRVCTHASSPALPTFFVTTPIYYLNSGEYLSSLTNQWMPICLSFCHELLLCHNGSTRHLAKTIVNHWCDTVSQVCQLLKRHDKVAQRL